MATTPSPRRACAERIAEFVRSNNLNNPYGGRARGFGNYYAIGVSVPARLDGEVRVWGETFIQMRLSGSLAGSRTSSVYESEANALEFLRLLLVDRDLDAAEAVPTKPGG